MEKNRIFYRLSALIIFVILFLAVFILLATYRMGVQYFRLIACIIAIFLFVIVALMLLGFLWVQNMLSHNKEPDGELLQEPINGTSKVSLITKVALRCFMPVLLSISDISNYYKDDIRRVYIKANNQYVLSNGKKVLKDKILVLLPHCLQNSKCNRRMRNGLDECIQCSACNIGSIKEAIHRYGVGVEIATGGTSARKIIHDRKPEFVIAVACERDLSSGLSDIKGIPVYGILNKRPNGPCKDTFVDINELEKAIEHFLA